MLLNITVVSLYICVILPARYYIIGLSWLWFTLNELISPLLQVLPSRDIKELGCCVRTTLLVPLHKLLLVSFDWYGRCSRTWHLLAKDIVSAHVVKTWKLLDAFLSSRQKSKVALKTLLLPFQSISAAQDITNCRFLFAVIANLPLALWAILLPWRHLSATQWPLTHSELLWIVK